MASLPAESPSPVRLERLGQHIALVTLSRPQARNAIDPDTAACLGRILEEIEADTDLRVTVLTGLGSCFCAGADLHAVARGLGPQLFTPGGGFAGFVDAPRTKPWIAAVNGPALAGGTEIVLACDLVVAADTATFGLPEVRRGLVAAAGGLYRLPARIPQAVALEAILTGMPFDAATALQHGLVNRVLPGAQLLDAAGELARRIAGNAPLAVRESLALVRGMPGLDEAALRERSQQARDRIRQSADFLEGPRAFLEKRAPRWSGR